MRNLAGRRTEYGAHRSVPQPLCPRPATALGYPGRARGSGLEPSQITSEPDALMGGRWDYALILGLDVRRWSVIAAVQRLAQSPAVNPRRERLPEIRGDTIGAEPVEAGCRLPVPTDAALGLDRFEQPMRRLQSDGHWVVSDDLPAPAAPRFGANVVRVWGDAACRTVAMLVKPSTTPCVLEVAAV